MTNADGGMLLRRADAGYENIDGWCGRCHERVIVNRATDLGNASYASRRRTPCPNCHAVLRIGGDTGNHPIDLILFDTYKLRLERRYMFGMLALAQALEITLAGCARFVFVQRPLVASVHMQEPAAPQLLNTFESKIRNMTLQPLRNLIIRCAVLR